jgi:hypothetical protein
MNFRSFLLIISVLTVGSAAFSQGFPGGGGGGGGLRFPGGGGGSGGGVSANSEPTLDTSEIHYFFADNPNLIFPFSDSLLETFQQYDPARQQPLDYAHLGNLGSAARPLFFQPVWRRGFDIGLHQFDLYQMTTNDVRYYKITQAYTLAGYTQGPAQTDSQFRIRFSRNFSNGLNLSLENRLISNTGAYDFQKARDSDVAAGLWYHHKNGRYDGFFSYVTNTARQQNNGGAAESLTDTLLPPYQVAVKIQTSQTRYANSEFAYTQYLRLNKRLFKREKTPAVPSPPADSLKKERPLGIAPVLQPPIDSRQPAVGTTVTQRAFTLYHQIAWRTASYKFYDTAPDSAFYGDFLVYKSLRHYLETKKLENTFKLQTFKLRERKPSDASAGQLPAESDLLEVGLIHSLHFVQQEPVDTGTINNVFLTGRLNFSPGDRMRLESYAHLSIGANAGDYRVNGTLFLNLKKIGTLQLEAVNQLYSPSLLPTRFYVSQQEIWKNDFQRTLETSLSGTYAIPAWRFSVTGQYHLVSNMVYFDTAALPRQSSAFSILQWMARKDFHIGPLHSENWVGIQEVTSDVLPLPRFYSKHSFYAEGKIFKKVMLAKLGVDARLCSGYDAPTYHPLVGQFILQNAQTLAFTPLLDAFLSLKVKTLRFFLKIENMLPFLTGDYYYQTAGYPLPYGLGNGGFRMGFVWRLVD